MATTAEDREESLRMTRDSAAGIAPAAAARKRPAT